VLEIVYSSRFKRDLRQCAKRQLDLTRLQTVIDTLRTPAALPAQNRDHDLTGNYSGFRECHVSPDWLLIYRVDGNALLLARTGSHSDLFS
jgi:mRNA interferase YafQ